MRALDRAIEKVGHDIENLKFNTAIAELMSLANWLRDSASKMSNAEWNHARRIIVLLLAPIEPFLTEELWSLFGEPESVHRQRWPASDPAALADWVARRVATGAWRYRARVTVFAPAAAVSERIGPYVGTVTAVSSESCTLDTGSDSLATMAVYLGFLGWDFRVDAPPELAVEVRALAERYQRALPGQSGSRPALSRP